MKGKDSKVMDFPQPSAGRLARIAVCEMPDDAARLPAAWRALAAFLSADAPADLLVLPELAASVSFWQAPCFDPAVWGEAVRAHEAMLSLLPGLNVRRVLGTRPVEDPRGRRLNQTFLWTLAGGLRPGRAKYDLPEEPGGYERTWFDRGDGAVDPVEDEGLRAATLVCTEVMVNPAPRRLARARVDVVAVPRATGNHPRWQVAVRMTAIASGAFTASSNRRGADENLFGGMGWVIGPDGDVLAETSAAKPFRVTAVDLAEADRAKGTYPRSVSD